MLYIKNIYENPIDLFEDDAAIFIQRVRCFKGKWKVVPQENCNLFAFQSQNDIVNKISLQAIVNLGKELKNSSTQDYLSLLKHLFIIKYESLLNHGAFKAYAEDIGKHLKKDCDLFF